MVQIRRRCAGNQITDKSS